MADGLGEDVGAGLLGLLGQPAVELGDRDDVVAVVAERRRRRLERQRALGAQHAVDARPWRPRRRSASLESTSGNSSWIARRAHHRAGEVVRAARPCPSRSPPPAPRRGAPSAPGRPPAAAAAGSRTPGRPGRRRRSRRRPRCARPRSSSSRLMNSCRRVDRRAGTALARRPCRSATPCAQPFFAFIGLGELGDDLVQVADDPEVGELEDRGVRVLVDRHDVLRGLHADLVLDRAGDAGRQVQLRRDGLARLADLGGVGVPAGVDHRAGGRDGAAAERARPAPRASSKPSALPRPRPPATRTSAPSMSTSAPRCSPRWTIVACVGLRRELDVDVLDRRPRRRRPRWPRTRSGGR